MRPITNKTRQIVDFANPEFVQYATSFGVMDHPVAQADELMPLLAQCLETDGVHLTDLPVDDSDNVRVLNEDLKLRSQQRG